MEDNLAALQFEDSSSETSTLSNHRSSGANSHTHSHSHEQLLSQAELRKIILQIQANTQLSATDKAKQMQVIFANEQLMSGNYSRKQLPDFTNTEQFVAKKYHDVEGGILGCKHYQRAVHLQAHCCGKWFVCRFCHDEASDHQITRNLTTTMMCMRCETVQPAGPDCIKCETRIAKYYCDTCKLWDNDPRKNIYHCGDCGICRIGRGLGDDYFHCQKCNVCMAINLKGRHKCIERNLESDCPICGEYMFTSTTTVIFMPCGHCIHYKCHQEYIRTNYQCPTCSKSLANMSEYFARIDGMLQHHTMPSEYLNTKSHVYCNDCEKKGWANFHFLYHKCEHCSGYNTKVLKTLEVGAD